MLGQNIASMDIFDKSASKMVDIMVLKTLLVTFVYCQAYFTLTGLSPNSRPKANSKFPKIKDKVFGLGLSK